jgi:tetratricopeptide (TPR) repeat protein
MTGKHGFQPGAAAGRMAGLAGRLKIRSGQGGEARRRRDLVLDTVPGDSSPADGVLAALLATRALAPFRGRAQELAELGAWCDDQSAPPVMVLTGPAGVGKTRLVAEFAARQAGRRVTGWLRPGCAGSALAAVRACREPTLVLVDDADERADLADLLGQLAAEPAGAPVRIVLISRIADPRGPMAEDLEEPRRWILADARLLPVTQFGSPDDHARWFAEAVRAYAAAWRTPPPDLPVQAGPGTANQPDEPILSLQARALLAVMRSQRVEPADAETTALPFDQVAEALFSRERRRWRDAAKRQDELAELTGDVLDRCVAALALTRAADEDQAVAVLGQLPDLADASAEQFVSIARWAAQLYPVDPPWPIRIEPAMLAEWFLVNQLTPPLARGLSGLGAPQAAALLACLARGSDHMIQAPRLFGDVLGTDVTGLAAAGVSAALAADTGQPALDAIFPPLIAGASWTGRALMVLDYALPAGLLPRTRQAVSAALVERARRSHAPEALADALMDLAIGSNDLGQYQEAMAAAEEALSIWRKVAEGASAFRSRLAGALQNLGTAQRGLDHHQEALDAAEEAAGIWRTLTESTPVAEPNLAGTLVDSAADLAALGRPQEALAAAEEGLRIWRTLDDGNPVAQAGLAQALASAANRTRALGRYQEALASTEEAVGIWRALIEISPAHRPDLARALSNNGIDLASLHRYPEALAATEEALGIWRTLGGSNPAWRLGLAQVRQNLSKRLGELHRYQEALAAAQEALSGWRTLADANPAYQPNLAEALSAVGADLFRVDRYQEALAMTQKAIGQWRPLAESNRTHRTGLARSLQTLGGEFHRLGRRQEAVTATEEAVGLWRTLAGSTPTARLELARTLHNLGVMLEDLGRNQEAQAAYQESAALGGQNLRRESRCRQEQAGVQSDVI